LRFLYPTERIRPIPALVAEHPYLAEVIVYHLKRTKWSAPQAFIVISLRHVYLGYEWTPDA
jgi:hypothetical protein